MHRLCEDGADFSNVLRAIVKARVKSVRALEKRDLLSLSRSSQNELKATKGGKTITKTAEKSQSPSL